MGFLVAAHYLPAAGHRGQTGQAKSLHYITQTIFYQYPYNLLATPNIPVALLDSQKTIPSPTHSIPYIIRVISPLSFNGIKKLCVRLKIVDQPNPSWGK
jgi:hypothetical protein